MGAQREGPDRRRLGCRRADRSPSEALHVPKGRSGAWLTASSHLEGAASPRQLTVLRLCGVVVLLLF